ncbi:MAG: tRNA (cytidine(34)-2'-O)-methyltransferase [Pseudomonadota bacterium]
MTTRAPSPLVVALFQPDIPHNTGALLRMGACLGVAIHVIEPAGFDMSDKRLKRAGMDYIELAALTRHPTLDAFLDWLTSENRRLVLLTTKAERDYLDFEFAPTDVILFGRESSGAPDFLHKRADHRLRIPMMEGARSLNLALSAALVTGEAIRQTGHQTQQGSA